MVIGKARREQAGVPWGVIARIAAAVGGGYLAACALGLLCLALLSPPPVDGVVTANLAAFWCYTAAAIWAFAARSPGRAWAGVAGGVAAVGGLLAGLLLGLPA